MILAGLDEAGRGPVIGSMFVALVAMEKEQLDKLVRLGLKESKALTPNKRKYFYNLILKFAKIVMVREVKVEDINKNNINDLTIAAMKELIEEALRKCKIDEVYVDIVGKGKKQEEELKKVFNNVKVLKRGDARSPIVAAASIVAKEMRERHVRELKKKYGDFGSGYPSDPKTVEWLRRNADAPVVRTRWKTVRRKGDEGGKRRETL